jgi:hypothetical protein
LYPRNSNLTVTGARFCAIGPNISTEITLKRSISGNPCVAELTRVRNFTKSDPTRVNPAVFAAEAENLNFFWVEIEA